jgi:two-component system chemotaxis response regulator CheB
LLTDLLQAGGFLVAGAASNGQDALEAIRQLQPDIVAMDIHLPGINGYVAAQQIMQSCPTPIVLVSGTHEAVQRPDLEALAAGALAVLRKPGNTSHPSHATDLANLLTTLRLMADVPVVTRFPQRLSSSAWPANQPPVSGTPPASPLVLAIAASTGGPAAIQTVLQGLGHDFQLPVLVVQHIAHGFVGPLAEWLATMLPLQLKIARHGERLLPGVVYLAPEDHHLLSAHGARVELRPQSADDRYCPSADLLFESTARVYGPRAIGVILTGMGDDGAAGLCKLRTAGGHTVGQDSASCVVYGMPKAAAEAQALVQIEPLDRIAPGILEWIGKTLGSNR